MIHFVSGEYPPDVGGVGDYTLNLRVALAEVGWQSDVLSRWQVRRWDVRSLIALLRAVPRTASLVHIQFQAGAYDLLGDVCLMPALLRRFRPGVRSVTTFHDVRVPYLFPRAGALREKALRLLANSSDALIAADSRDLEALGGPSSRHFHVPIGSNVACAAPADFERDAFRSSLGLERDGLAVVYFGLLNSSKGLDLLLDTFEQILRRCPGARLLMLGAATGASDSTDRQTASKLQSRLDLVGQHVIRTGQLPPTHLSAYLLACDVALLPYADGASPRRGSLLACAAHALPIVSTIPAAAEIAPYIEAVAQDAAQLADAVLRVRSQPSALRAASRVLAKKTSWPLIAAAHVDIYNRLLHSQA